MVGLSLTLRQTLDLKQELRQELRLKLIQKIPEEFQPYIDIDSDEDMDLLMNSLPFLVLHELAHPLQREGHLVVPKYEYDNVPEGISISDLNHNANEIGIDRGAILAGVHTKSYTADDMYDSQAYLAERVFRDVTERGEYCMSNTIYPRLYAGLKENILNTKFQPIEMHLEDVCKKIDDTISESERNEFDRLVNHYRKIYSETSLVNPK